ncbi:MAG: hypothetical protein H6834_17035, partial [Planctomycetes bacterium]|nr:hypothetical protein [Planctomycetota bacterium]
QDGRTWVTETEKEVARIHELDAALLDGLWAQVEDEPGFVPTPSMRPGVTLELELTLASSDEDRRVWESIEERGGQRVALQKGTLVWELWDERNHIVFRLEPGRLSVGARHQVFLRLDAEAHLIDAWVDGIFCDGGTAGQVFGWVRFADGVPWVMWPVGSSPACHVHACALSATEIVLRSR